MLSPPVSPLLRVIPRGDSTPAQISVSHIPGITERRCSYVLEYQNVEIYEDQAGIAPG